MRGAWWLVRPIDMKPQHRYLLECVTGNVSPEAQAWAVAAVARWWHEGDALQFHRCAGLGTRQKTVDAIRNDLLRQAAEQLDGCPTKRAEMLAEMCKHFECQLWPLWCNESEAPARAGPVNKLLFEAKRLGANLPCSVRMVFGIIGND